MHIAKTYASVAILLGLSLLAAHQGHASTGDDLLEASNTAIVARAFDAWRDGKGTVVDLLSEDAQWTVAGVSPSSGTYSSRGELVERAVKPIHARLLTPITPTLRTIVAQGDKVVVFWDGEARARDGGPYRNSYAWLLIMDKGKIARVTAYLDTWALAELMSDRRE